MMLETDSSLQIENLLKHEKIDLLSGDIEQKLKDFFSKLSIDMKQKYDEKEEAIQRISVKIQEAEQDFKLNLDIKSKKLQDVSKLVNDTILKYRLASENAIRIGNRLSSIESERSRLVKAIRLLQAINSLEKIEPVEFQESLNSMEDFSTLRQSLPRSLRISDLNEFSQVIFSSIIISYHLISYLCMNF